MSDLGMLNNFAQAEQTSRAEKRNIIARMMDQATKDGRELTPEDVNNMIYQMGGNDLFLRAEFPRGQLLEQQLRSQNEAAMTNLINRRTATIQAEANQRNTFDTVVNQMASDASQEDIAKQFGELGPQGQALFNKYAHRIPEIQAGRRDTAFTSIVGEMKNLLDSNWYVNDTTDKVMLDKINAQKDPALRERLSNHWRALKEKNNWERMQSAEKLVFSEEMKGKIAAAMTTPGGDAAAKGLIITAIRQAGLPGVDEKTMIEMSDRMFNIVKSQADAAGATQRATVMSNSDTQAKEEIADSGVYFNSRIASDVARKTKIDEVPESLKQIASTITGRFYIPKEQSGAAIDIVRRYYEKMEKATTGVQRDQIASEMMAEIARAYPTHQMYRDQRAIAAQDRAGGALPADWSASKFIGTRAQTIQQRVGQATNEIKSLLIGGPDTEAKRAAIIAKMRAEIEDDKRGIANDVQVKHRNQFALFDANGKPINASQRDALYAQELGKLNTALDIMLADLEKVQPERKTVIGAPAEAVQPAQAGTPSAPVVTGALPSGQLPANFPGQNTTLRVNPNDPQLRQGKSQQDIMRERLAQERINFFASVDALMPNLTETQARQLLSNKFFSSLPADQAQRIYDVAQGRRSAQ